MPQATKDRSAVPERTPEQVAVAARVPAEQVHLDLLDSLTDVLVRLKRRAGDPESAARMFLLSHVDRHAPVRATDLAEHVGLDLSTVSRHLRALEDDGLVVRSPDPDDRRAARLELSAEGHAALARALRARAEAVAAATTSWTPTDLTNLEQLLARLADDLENTP